MDQKTVEKLGARFRLVETTVTVVTDPETNEELRVVDGFIWIAEKL